MRCLKLEIDKFNDAERRKEAYELARQCQHASNTIWRVWECWHNRNDSGRLIREYLDALASWREQDKKSRREKPKLLLYAIDKELSKEIRDELSARYPTLNSRVKTLLDSTVTGGIKTRKAANGSLSGWMAILLDHEGRPSFTRPVPIPFDSANAKVTLEDGSVYCSLRLNRHETEAGRGASDVWKFALKTSGKISRYAQPIYDVANGVTTLKGCDLFYDSSRKKWFVLVAYQEPEQPKPALDTGKTLFIRAANKRPFNIRVGGQSRWIGDSGDHVAHRRRQVVEGRRSRQNNYRWANPSRKGHGVETALVPIEKLQKSWKYYCKSYCESIATAVIDRAVELKCGKVVMLRKPGCYLETCGKNPEIHDSTAWPWYYMESFFNRKCAELGIVIQVARDRARVTAE